MPTKQELIDRVEWHAEQVTVQGESLGLNKDAVYQQLKSATRTVLRKAPARMLRTDTTAGHESGTKTKFANETGPPPYTRVEPPKNYLRFLMLKLTSWERPVYQLIRSRSDQHRLQSNEFAQADTSNPIVVPDTRAGAGKIFRCYPQTANAGWHHFAYVADQAPEAVDSRLIDPVVLLAASQVVQSGIETEADVDAVDKLNQRADRRLVAVQNGEIPLFNRTDTDES